MTETYDYIVVGAGAAGCAVAARLSESSNTKVLLLEAGVSDQDPELRKPIQIPKYFQFMQKSIADWDYETEPQAHLGHRRIYTPRGKILGGTSTFIAGLFVRGNQRNFDEWAEQTRDESWRYENVLPYFIKMEKNMRPNIGVLHGKDGPLQVQDIRPHPATRAFFESAREQGYDRSEDFNDLEQVGGASPYQLYMKGSVRVNSANGYLTSTVRDRPNLTIETHAEAQKILFADGNKAVGVEYDKKDAGQQARSTVKCSREVILCGGSINSPKLLLQSGVGPASHLRECGIEVIHDLPGVGENYHDQPIAGIIYSYKKKARLPNPDSAGIEGGLFIRTQPQLAIPDLQFVFNAANVGPPQTFPDWSQFSLVGALVQPKSRGRLQLDPANPAGKPRIFANYLAVPEDMAVLVEAIKIARRLIANRRLDAWRGQELAPGPDVQSDEEIAAYIRQSAGTLFHPVGTCKMGIDPSRGDVVNSKLEVFGLRGVRVVDASIMPIVTCGNTYTPTVMIGEKGAAMIAQEGQASRSRDGVYRSSCYRVRPGTAEQLKKAAEDYLDYVKMNEPGTRRYLVVQSDSAPEEFAHVAEFDDHAAFETSQGSAAYQSFTSVLRSILAGEVRVEATEGALVAGGGISYHSDSDLLVRVWVKVKDRRKLPRFRELINELYDIRWQRKGLLEWDVWEDPQDDLRFLLVERWVSQEAQSIHVPNFEEFISLIEPTVLVPYKREK